MHSRQSWCSTRLSAGSRDSIRRRRGIINRFAAAAACLWLAAVAAPAMAATYYVAPPPTGNDNNPGTLALPFEHIQHGNTALQPGDTLFILGGTYKETVTFSKAGTVISGYQNQTAIIDGEFDFPTGGPWDPLVRVTENDVEIRNLSITRSAGFGLVIAADDVLVDNVKASFNWKAGIHVIDSNRVTVQSSELWQNVYCNSPAEGRDCQPWSYSLSNVDSDDTIFRDNEVYQGHGENIGDLRSNNTTIEDNVVWDAYAIGIYLDNSRFTTVQRNIVYSTNDTSFWRYADQSPPRPTPGIVVNNEIQPTQNFNSNQLIVNNFVYNTGLAFGVWGGVAGNSYTSSTIANNTFVSTRTGATGSAYKGVELMNPSGTTRSGNAFKNNIVYQVAGTAATGSTTGFSISHNNWSGSVSGGFSNPATDVPGNPQLVLGSGEHPSSGWLKLSSSASPAIDAAEDLTGVPEDFFGVDRGLAPDIGAHEFTVGASEPSLLSFQKPATASSQNSGGVTPAMAVDGNMGTKWLPNGVTQPFPHWWRVDLGQRYFLTELKAYWWNSWNRYKIEVSDDGVNYTTVVDRTGTQVFGNTIDAMNAVGRYVRVTVTDSADAWGGAYELEVYGRPSLSLLEPATASSQNSGGVTPAMAVDGNMGTKWLPNGVTQQFPHWWRVDLGQSYALTAVAAYWWNPWNRYKIEVSTDGVNYTTVVDRTGAQVVGNTIDTLNAVGRYVRMTMTDSADNWPGAYEFEVY